MYFCLKNAAANTWKNNKFIKHFLKIKSYKKAKIVTISFLIRDFRIPDGFGDSFEAEGYSEPASEEFCKSLGQKCPFSLLEYLLYD